MYLSFKNGVLICVLSHGCVPIIVSWALYKVNARLFKSFP